MYDDRVTGNGQYVELWPEMSQEVAQARTLAAYKALGRQNPQPKWGSLISNGWAQVLYQYIKSKGAVADDTLNELVYEIGRDDNNATVFLVPVSQFYDAGKVKTLPRYREVHVGEDAQAQVDQAFDQRMKDAQARLVKARNDAELKKIEDQISKLNQGTPSSSSGSGAGVPGSVTVTYELYGILNGANVPLSRVVLFSGSSYQVTPGGRVMLGNSPADGYGFAGMPGKWSLTYPSASPAQYGLDADKGVLGFDGSRAWAIPATTLAQLFGANWRQVIYV